MYYVHKYNYTYIANEGMIWKLIIIGYYLIINGLINESIMMNSMFRLK